MARLPDPAQAAKQRLRGRMRARRAALAPARRAAAAQAIAARCRTHPVVARARSVFVFVSTPEEVATHDLIDWFVVTGRQVLVPLLAGRDLMHAVPFPGWAAMAPAALGILSPPADSLPWPSPVDLVLAPGLAFTPYGARLGYGAGYYDAWIARNAPGALLALAFDCQVVDRLPESPHDRRVDGIVTESRDIDCAACRDET